MSYLKHLPPEPDYEDPYLRSEIGKLIDRCQRFNHNALQEFIDTTTECLEDALDVLHDHQQDIGFIRDDGSKAARFKIVGPGGEQFFLVQFNSRRLERKAGAGRKEMPPGAGTVNTADPLCFLCADNMRWQQRGVQDYYTRVIRGGSYNFCCNPFPFGKKHFTVASAIKPHVSQRLSDKGETEAGCVESIIEDLYELVEQAQSYLAIFNGVSAGASIWEHLHFHLMKRPSALFPLQAAAEQAEAAVGTAADLLYIAEPFYPLPAFRLRGGREAVVRNAVSLARRWRGIAGGAATENLIVITEEGSITMYYIPRDKEFCRAAELAGEAGGLETLGEFVMSTENERRLLEEGRINYDSLQRILQAVRPLRPLHVER
jgi:hypothetical protein